jgi:Xaa-Pro aminopeptidase
MRYIASAYPTVPCRWFGTQSVFICEGDKPIVSCSTVMDPFRMRDYFPWLPADHVTKDISGSRTSLTAESWEPFADLVIGMMKEHGVENKKIALDLCPVPDTCSRVFRDKGYTVIIPLDEMAQCRRIKSVDEVACMKISASIAEAAMYSIQKKLHPAIHENELTALGVRRQYDLAADEVVPVNVASGWRTNPMHADFTDRLVLAGETVAVHVDDVCYNGYKTSLGRTFVVGKATQGQKDAYATALKLMQDAIAAIKPGGTTKDVLAVWPKDPSFWGYESPDDVRRFAHGNGIGLMFEDGFSFSAADQDEEPVPFEIGMTMALETWYGPRGAGYGASIKETVIVTERGCELLTQYPVDQIIEVPLGQ